MILFVAFCLIVSFIVQTDNPLQDVLASPVFINVGLIGSTTAIAGSMLKKWPDRVGYDVFASSTLLIWYAYWQPYFNKESPIFFFFPIFFAGMTIVFSLAFINNRHKIDSLTLQQMRILSGQAGLQPWFIMLCVLGSLKLQDHYLIYPVTTTLMLLRFTLSSCIERNDA